MFKLNVQKNADTGNGFEGERKDNSLQGVHDKCLVEKDDESLSTNFDIQEVVAGIKQSDGKVSVGVVNTCGVDGSSDKEKVLDIHKQPIVEKEDKETEEI